MGRPMSGQRQKIWDMGQSKPMEHPVICKILKDFDKNLKNLEKIVKNGKKSTFLMAIFKKSFFGQKKENFQF